MILTYWNYSMLILSTANFVPLDWTFERDNFAFERETICTQFKKKRKLLKLWNRLEIWKGQQWLDLQCINFWEVHLERAEAKKNVQSKTDKRLILGFHVRSEKKLRLKILGFYLYQVKDIFKQNLLACLQLDRPLCFGNRTQFFHNVWHRHCFRVTCYMHENINSPCVFGFWVTNMLREVPTSLTERINVLREPK